MSRHQLIDHICALRCVGEECANKHNQFPGLVVDQSTFIKEVANVCQRCFLQRKPFELIQMYPRNTRTRSSDRYENLSHAGTHATTKEGYIQHERSGRTTYARVHTCSGSSMNNPSRECNMRQSSLNRWDSTSVMSGSASMSSMIHVRQKFTRDPSAPKYWDLLRIPYMCPMTKQSCEGGLDGSPSIVSQPSALAREHPLRLLHIHHNALVPKC